jgi:hypothetical protein
MRGSKHGVERQREGRRQEDEKARGEENERTHRHEEKVLFRLIMFISIEDLFVFECMTFSDDYPDTENRDDRIDN